MLFGSVPSFFYRKWHRSVNTALVASAPDCAESPIRPLSLLAAPYQHEDEEASCTPKVGSGATIPKCAELDSTPLDDAAGAFRTADQWVRTGPPPGGVECRRGSSIIKTASPKKALLIVF